MVDQAVSVQGIPPNVAPDAPVVERCSVSLRMVCVCLLALIGVAGIRGYWLWRSPPAYWQAHQQYLQQTTAQYRLALSQAVERRILEQLSFSPVNVGLPADRVANDLAVEPVAVAQNTIRADVDVAVGGRTGRVGQTATKEIFLSIEEINAWMDQRLKDWASHQGTAIPDDVTDPMVAIDGQHLVFAFRSNKPNFSQVVSAVAKVVIEPGQAGRGDQAKVRIVKMRSGRLRIPSVPTVSRTLEQPAGASTSVTDMAAQITEAFDGQAFDPVIKMNNQKIRVVGFTLTTLPEEGLQLSLKADGS